MLKSENTILNEFIMNFLFQTYIMQMKKGCFYKHLSAYTYHKRGLNCAGYKEDNKRVSILLCCNALGTEKLIVI